MSDESGEKTQIPELEETEEPTPAPERKEIQEVVVREYPKTVLFYPMLFVSLFIAIAGYLIEFVLIIPDPTLRVNLLYTLTFIWFVLFFFNLLVVTFEFGKSIVVALALIIVIIIMVVAFVFTIYGYFLIINPANLLLYMNAPAILAFIVIFSFVIFLSWIKTRMYYFRVTPNEIIYKKGLLGDVERYGTSNVMVHKEIRDLFEFLLMRSGRLTFTVPGRKTTIVLDNVPNINKVEEQILYILRRIEVDID